MLELGNIISWVGQVLLIAAAGALLPIGLRVRHPRTYLVYSHLLLAACLILPIVQPWKHPVVLIPPAPRVSLRVERAPVQAAAGVPAQAVTAEPASEAEAPKIAREPRWRAELPAKDLVLWVLVAGIAGRFAFLLIGLWQIRRRRIGAIPLYPIPESVQAAAAITHTNALFCVSSEVPGPVMLGWLTPVVLLPESFLALPEEAQCCIACHELLHVARNDWMVSLLEEIAGALLWFNPAIWLLLAQTRLAREELVDAEVVLLTSAREPYIEALLSFAKARPGLDLAPAPLFLRRRHLTQRMHSLLTEVRMSRFRLVTSYSSIAAMLAFAGWFAFASFPLVGRPHYEQIAEAAPEPQVPAEAPIATPAAAVPVKQKAAPLVIARQSPQPSLPPREVRGPSVSTPNESHEPVTGGAQTPTNPADRASALALLLRATENSRMHIRTMHPFILKVSFLASGPVTYTGPGEVGETWLSGQKWRMTGSLAGNSFARIGSGQQGIDEKRVSFIPMRVQMMRDAIFWAARSPAATASIRTAPAEVNGKSVTCILSSRMPDPGIPTRLWEEEEHCIDNATGTLQLYSVAPGTYVIYGYSKNQQFYGRSMPDQITVYINGITAIEAQVSLTDAGTPDESLFTVTPEMMANGPGLSLITAQRFAIDIPNSGVGAVARPVIVHATINPDGKVVEEELSSAADPSLATQALDLVKQRNFGPAGWSQRDAYINVRFVN